MSVNAPKPCVWHPTSWKACPIKQAVTYEDTSKEASVMAKLEKMPPLVAADEVEALLLQLGQVERGERFLLQGGDCAESFGDCSADKIENKLKVLLQMSLVLVWGGRIPVVRVARLGGQYGKPRSSPTETVSGMTVHSFRGENINGIELEDRTPDPERLLRAYFHSAATVNYMRALLNGDFASLHHPSTWDLKRHLTEAGSVSEVSNETTHGTTTTDRQRAYRSILNRLDDALDFLHTIGVDTDPSMRKAEFYTSHEALVLPYESAFTRQVVCTMSPRKRAPSLTPVGAGASAPPQDYFNLSAHFVWLGDRTRDLDGAHVEYLRGKLNTHLRFATQRLRGDIIPGIRNPIGVKAGPTMKPADLCNLLRLLNPHGIPGKITIITRLGVGKVSTYLPPLLNAVHSAKLSAIWCCDPMHGNTRTTANGVKTRYFADIVGELHETFRIHMEHHSTLNGVHFELCGEPGLTECVGGVHGGGVGADDLARAYETLCDPRLNYEQSLDVAFSIAEYYEQQRASIPPI